MRRLFLIEEIEPRTLICTKARMLFSTESRRLVFTEPTTMKSLLTRGGYDPINIGPSRMFARPSKFLEFERIRFRLSALQVIRMRHSKLREYGFSSRLLK